MEPTDRRGTQDFGKLGVLAEARRCGPPLVTGDRQAGGECPANSGSGQLQGRDPAGLLDQPGVSRRTQTDVVGKDDRPVHIVMPVNRVDPVNDRDLEPALECP